MSIPVMKFSVPPPRLDVPPPVAIPSSVPPPQLFSHPPPYAPLTLPAVDKPPPLLPVDMPPPPYGPMTTLPPMNVPPPYPVVPIDVRSVPPPSSFYSAPNDYASTNYNIYSQIRTGSCSTDWQTNHNSISFSSGKSRSHSERVIRMGEDSIDIYSRSSTLKRSSPSRDKSYGKDHDREKEMRYRDRRYSRSPNHHSRDTRRSRSPNSQSHKARRSRSSNRQSRDTRRSRSPNRQSRDTRRSRSCSPNGHSRDTRRSRSPNRQSRDTRCSRSRSPNRRSRDTRCSRSFSHTIHREKERSYRQRFDERQEFEEKRREYERRHDSSRIRDFRSHSRASCVSRRLRSPSRGSVRSPTRAFQESRLRSRTREMSHVSHASHVSNASHASNASRHTRHAPSTSTKPLSDREKILEEYRKNYCQTSDDFIKKLTQWHKKEHNSDEEETSNMWYRSSPADLYYKQVEGGEGVQQTPKLEKICDTFFQQLIDRGRKARPEADEMPILKPRNSMCNHTEDGSSSSSESEDECLDEEGLQGYTDRIMLELQRKQSHPRRLHPEMWFNNTGEMNGGPLCRCSARARRQGMRHGVYANEETFPKCIPNQSNIDKLYHYRITVSPPTNFLIKCPTIISHDEHEFLFSGFSMFSHYKLAKLPTCKVIRFNIEYTILYVEEPPPQNFTVKELDLFEEFLFYELLELVDLDLGKATDTTCSQFHFMPRFVRYLPDGGCEVLSMCEVLKYLIAESGLLIPPGTLENVHAMDHFNWQKFVDKIKGMIVTYPGKKPCSVRVDQLDRSPPNSVFDDVPGGSPIDLKTYYPEIVHFGIRPPQLSYAGNPEYQKAWRYYVKYRHLIANMAKPTYKERQKLATKEAKLSEMRTQSKMKRDVTVAISSEGFHTTGLMCDVVQHAMLIPVLVRHLRFHKSLDSLETKLGYKFKQRALLQTALTHPSYRENFGTNPDHARNSLTNCGIRQPEYGDRRIHYTRKKGIVTLINIMSRFGRNNETESDIKHNERLEFLGDAVVEFLSSIHLFRMFPGLAEGGLATYRASIVQNQHLAQLAKNIELEHYMLYAHGSDLCREVVMRHAMANCFEALMGSLFLDAGIEANAPGKERRNTYSIQVEVADRVFALALWHNQPDLLEVWAKERAHPLQEQEPLGDRKYIKDFEFLQQLTHFENSIGIQFKHIRLLARAFTDRSVGFTHLTLGSNQRLEFLGDTVLQLVVSDRLYRHFPDHHEGHLSLLRSSLVNNRTQSLVCDDLNMSSYAIYNNPKAKPTTKKHKADLLEAFLGALYIDKDLDYCTAFCNACLFPRLQEFIMNQDWNDPKSKLQQCCLTLRSMEGGEPDIPMYKVIECLGPTNTRVYTVGVYFRGQRLAEARGHSIQEAEMNSAEKALSCAHELFPQLDHQKRVIAKSMRRKKKRADGRNSPSQDSAISRNRKRLADKVPKAYRLGKDQYESSDESCHAQSDAEVIAPDESNDDSGLDSDSSLQNDKLDKVQVSSLLSDMQKIKEDLIRRNEYEKLKEKCRRSDSDTD